MCYSSHSLGYTRHIVETLLSHFPELGPAIDCPQQEQSLPQLLDVFATFTRQAAAEGSLPTLKECLLVADTLRSEDPYLAIAVQYFYLPCLHFGDDAYAAQLARLLMPRPLYVAFCHYH